VSAPAPRPAADDAAPAEPGRAAAAPAAGRGPWHLRDLVLLAVLGTVFGFLYYALVAGWSGLQVLMGPLGDLAQNVLWGGWMVVAPLAIYIVRRPGAGVLAEVLAAFVEFAVLGSPFGPALLVTALVQGAGAEAVFAATRYRRYSWPVFVASGAVAGLAIFAYQAVVQGWLGQDILLLRFVLHMASCVLLTGVLARLLGDALLRTGVLDDYAIGRAARGRR
jgi:energy-coupling factor transport system permease protein